MSVIAGEDGQRNRSRRSLLASSSKFCGGGAAASAREATRGLDGTGKISKDMAMTAMPRIDARRSCADRGAEQ